MVVVRSDNGDIEINKEPQDFPSILIEKGFTNIDAAFFTDDDTVTVLKGNTYMSFYVDNSPDNEESHYVPIDLPEDITSLGYDYADAAAITPDENLIVWKGNQYIIYFANYRVTT